METLCSTLIAVPCLVGLCLQTLQLSFADDYTSLRALELHRMPALTHLSMDVIGRGAAGECEELEELLRLGAKLKKLTLR